MMRQQGRFAFQKVCRLPMQKSSFRICSVKAQPDVVEIPYEYDTTFDFYQEVRVLALPTGSIIALSEIGGEVSYIAFISLDLLALGYHVSRSFITLYRRHPKWLDIHGNEPYLNVFVVEFSSYERNHEFLFWLGRKYPRAKITNERLLLLLKEWETRDDNSSSERILFTQANRKRIQSQLQIMEE